MLNASKARSLATQKRALDAAEGKQKAAQITQQARALMPALSRTIGKLIHQAIASGSNRVSRELSSDKSIAHAMQDPALGRALADLLYERLRNKGYSEITVDFYPSAYERYSATAKPIGTPAEFSVSFGFGAE